VNAEPGADFTVRPLTDFHELQRCADFQREIWGADFAELVPAAILWVATRTGGVVAGAFDDQDELLGFVFGITGYRDGEPMHWSDMLAARPDTRGRGVGAALKRHQRTILLDAGVRRVGWTFDPLESRNAYLNFARLGATAREYVVDCYGNSASPLHAGLGTDRLIARWTLDSPRVRSRMEDGERPPTIDDVKDVPVINAGGCEPDLTRDEPLLRLQFPADIQALKAVDPAAARRWRATTRRAFQGYFAREYEAVDVVRESGERSRYVLARRG
jgi:predicted GNAT superfamily acetyltransferase